MQWLRSQNPPCSWDENTCARAAKSGHLHILQWLRSQNPPCPWDECCCYAAAYAGHGNIVRWLRSQNPPCRWNDEVFENYVALKRLMDECLSS